MKKSFIISALLILALTILLLGGACTPKEEAPAGTITLKLTHYFPASMYFQVEQCPRYFEMVEKAAKGKYTLNIEYYPVGTLIAPPDIHDGTVKGITDIGLATPGYTPGRCPVMETILVPGVAPEDDCYTGSLIFWEFYKKYKPEEYADVKMLYCYSVGPGYIHSKTPIRSVADMEDVKMRVYGTMVPAVKLLGGEPVAMPMADLYEAVTKGLLDAVVGPPETLKSHKHAELFDYSTFVPGLYHGLQVLIMNRKRGTHYPGTFRMLLRMLLTMQ
jgi:TRAP-type C4-dicarboxylate transport system substrate-binding protein